VRYQMETSSRTGQ